VNPQLTLIVYCLGYFAVLTALGSGPALALARSVLPASPILLAPCIGVALAGAGLVSAWPFMTMDTAAWAVLVPACLASLGWAVVSVRRHGIGDLTEVTVPGAFVALGVLISTLPALLRGTVGPTSLFVLDAVGYLPIDQWMRDAREGTPITPFMERWDMSGAKGWEYSHHGARVGVSAINGSVSALFETTPDQTHLAFLAVLFGLLPLSVWIVARGVGIGRVGASVGAAFGLSPALYTMVADSTLANLTGLVLIAPLLLVAGLAAARGGFRLCVLAGILLGGLIADFPEYLSPTAVVAGLAAVMLVIVRVREKSFTRVWVMAILTRSALTLAAVVLVWWFPIRRAEVYVSQLLKHPDASTFAGLPPRFITLKDFGAWAFGVLHLYQLPRFAILSSPREAFAIILPILLGVLVIWGSARLGLWRATLLLAPVAISIPLALEAHDRYQGGHCEYCEWKALTYILPFLAIGVAAGSDRIWRAIRQRRGTWRLAAIAAGLVPLTGVAALAYANERLGEAVYESPAVLTNDLREVTASIGKLPAPRRVLIDAPDADNQSPFQLPATYNLLRQTPDTYISFDASGIAPSYLYPLYLPIPKYYSSTYRYVLTPFAGMATGRRVLERRGNFSLEERRKIDVTIARTGWTLDTHQGAAAIPWLQSPIRLWIASPTARHVTLRISLDRPLHDRATLTFATERGRPLRVVPNADGSTLCVSIEAAAGRTAITASPQIDTAPPPAVRNTESDPLPSPPRAIGLAGLRADPTSCPRALERNLLPSVSYGNGWFAPETDPGGQGTYRWMGTAAAFSVGDPGVSHPAVVLHSTISSLVIPRNVTVTIDGRLVKTLQAPPGAPRPFTIRIPAGRGLVRIALRADPGAGPATQVTPADNRMLAVRLLVPDVTRS
jgi:hypothetical protein